MFIKCTYFQGQLVLVPLRNVENEAHFSGISVTPITFDAHSGMNAVVPSWLFLFGIWFFQCSDEEEKELRSTWTSKPWRVEPTHTHLHSSTHHYIKSIAITYALSCRSQICFPKLKASHFPVNAILVEIFCSNHKILVNGRQVLQPSQLVLQQFIIMVQLGINKGSRYGDPEVMIQ